MEQLAEQDWAAAQANLETAVRFDPNHGRAFNNLGWVYYKNGQFYRAARTFQAAMQALPDHPAPISNLGLTMAAAGRWDDAVELQTRANALNPDNPKYQARLAFARVKRGDQLATIRSLLETVISTNNQDDWASWARGLLAQLDHRSAGPGATVDETY
ncbi:MAG: tetratricopeptide repeat protein [Planctomycetota bacterium]